MRILLFIPLLSLLILNEARAQAVKRPKLVVGIVIDQMRWDYLYRYAERYGKGGFKRLMKEGFNCQNTYIDYLPTFTAPGHASIYTGSVPALHGIVANDWIDARTGRQWYCTEDTSAHGVGGGKAGQMSPRNMKANTITDELRLATNFSSRTFGVALKDRGAILPAGHAANGAFWYDGSSGDFISSDFYMKELPKWIETFNSRKVVDSLMAIDWPTLYPIGSYRQSEKDENRYEGKPPYAEKATFPHKTSLSVSKSDIRLTPQGNTLTRMLAETCIINEKLGQNGATDFLAVSFSSTDYIGHMYGPNSIEVEDTYLRLDKELETFLRFLDKEIGTGQYLLFLSADHGGAHNALFLEDHKIPARSVSIKNVLKDLNQFLMERFGDSSLVSSLYNYQVHFNEAAFKSLSIDRDVVKRSVIDWFQEQDGITVAVDIESPEKYALPELLKTMIANGIFRKRSGTIQLVLDPGWYSGYGNTGTTHGGWNPYDAHIPLLFYGWGVKKGESRSRVSISDIAPTLAGLLHIQEPNACIGKPITELFKD